MGSILICEEITTFIEETIVETITNIVTTFVTVLTQVCQNLPWPLSWLCNMVATVIQVVTTVITTVVSTIITAVVEIICVTVFFPIYWILSIIAIIVDGLCWRCNMVNWVNIWFKPRTKCEFIKKEDLFTGQYEYTFSCLCKGKKIPIVVTAYNDTEAAKLAKKQLKKQC